MKEPTFTAGRWQAIEELYHAALAVSPDRRERFLEEAVGGDVALRDQVRSLLAWTKNTGELTPRSSSTDSFEQPGDRAPIATLSPSTAAARRWPTIQAFLASTSPWVGVVAWIAIAKVLIGVIVALARMTSLIGDPLPAVRILPLAMTAAYGAAGSTLFLTGRADPRCVEFGVYLLLVASAFADASVDGAGWLTSLRTLMAVVRVDALMPLFFWLFVRDFPFRAPLGRFFRVPMFAARVSLVVGLTLWALNVAHEAGKLAGTDLTGWTAPFARDTAGGFYWVIISVLSVPSAPLLVARARHVPPDERRRVMLFVGGIVAGLLPLGVDLVRRPTQASIVVALAFLSVPFTTAYAVLVAHVADLRVIIRVALQYALARATLLTVVCLPLAWLGWLLFENRAATIQELMVGRSGQLLLAASAAALVALRLRAYMLRVVDRRFFREQYDAEQILRDLVSSCGHTQSSRELAALIASEIDRALHVRRILVLERQPDSSIFSALDGSVRQLSASATLLHLVSSAADALDIDADDSRAMRASLSIDEQAWLLDCDARLLLPLKTAPGGVAGLLVLGPKRSELPYSARDRRLLGALGSAGGLLLERRGAPGVEGTAPLPASEESAVECPVCGRVSRAGVRPCRCDARPIDAPVPFIVAQKFRIEQRIGAGGMGVVYRALDLALNRIVAIKTLPVARPTATWRLKREARAMARVTHPHLALILGAESWRGRPLLVVEYLAGGTLADKLGAGPLSVQEVVSLGVVLADVLDALHAVGLLHRDVKPSNIGYTAAGSIKLLDFGLARRFDGRDESSGDIERGSEPADPGLVHRSLPHLVLGTPAYMSPEAIRGDPPEASFDLWSLSVVLFEAATGVNPFVGGSIVATWSRIAALDVAELRRHVAGVPRDMGEFLCRALAPVKHDRPGSAREIRNELTSLRTAEPALRIGGTSALSG